VLGSVYPDEAAFPELQPPFSLYHQVGNIVVPTEPKASKFSVQGREDTGAQVVVNREVVVTAVPEQVALVAITCTS
jgi:hypothetical protein